MMYAPGGGNLTVETQSDLEAGFESAQGNNTLGAMASAWQRETAQDVTAVSAEESIEAEANVESMPHAATNERYQEAPTVADAGLPPLPEPDERYTPAMATEEPHSANETIARGQSPTPALQPIDALPDNNPLRSAEVDPFDSPAPLPNDNNRHAEQAFNAPAPAPMVDATPAATAIGPEPMETVAGNPLRSAPAPAPAPLQDAARYGNEPPLQPAAFAGAQPMAASQYSDAGLTGTDTYADAFDAAPDELEPTMADPRAAEPVPQPASEPQYAGSAPAAREPSPTEPLAAAETDGDYNAFAPGPSTMATGPAIDEGTGRPGERALEGPQRPALVLQKFAPEEIQVGKECKFVIKVRNVGQHQPTTSWLPTKCPKARVSSLHHLQPSPRVRHFRGNSARFRRARSGR